MNLLLLFAACVLVGCVHADLVVHEWGTYTSLQGSTGIPIAGMHHGEESLPHFVHSRADEYTHEMFLASQSQKRGIIPPPLATANTPKNCYFCEVMDWVPTAGTPREVTQKLETPVIYFYTRDAIDNVTVIVDFPFGIITETYPAPARQSPAIGKVTATAKGHAEWDLAVAKKGQRLEVPSVSEENIWAPSRHVSANFVSSNSIPGETEHHVFYRGLGHFQGPVSVTSDKDFLYVENLSDEIIPATWVLVSDGDNGGFVRELNSIPAQGMVKTPLNQQGLFLVDSLSTEMLPMVDYIAQASVLLEVGLTKAGLYPLEARAMVNTWSNSYFKQKGARLLYISPSSFPDVLLPLSIKSDVQPTETVRVLVGRVEVILSVEEEILSPIASGLIQNSISSPMVKREYQDYIHNLGRFAEAKIRSAIGDLTPVENAFSEKMEEYILKELTY